MSINEIIKKYGHEKLIEKLVKNGKSIEEIETILSEHAKRLKKIKKSF